MAKRKNKVTICPLIYFQSPAILVRTRRKEKLIFRDDLKAQKPFEILDNVRMRLFNTEDMQKLREFSAIDLVKSYEKFFSKIGYTTFVLEFVGKSDEDEKFERTISKIRLAIKLHKPISVFNKIMWSVEESRVISFGILDSFLPSYEQLVFRESLQSVNELEEIRKILKKIDKIDFDQRKSLWIACERFSRAFEEYREDEIIIDLMIAFEALFLRGEKISSSIGQFIGLGCSMLLGKDDEERRKIKEFLRKSYTIRNKIVHGSEYPTPIKINNEEYTLRALILQLQKYLSTAIKILLT